MFLQKGTITKHVCRSVTHNTEITSFKSVFGHEIEMQIHKWAQFENISANFKQYYFLLNCNIRIGHSTMRPSASIVIISPTNMKGQSEA